MKLATPRPPPIAPKPKGIANGSAQSRDIAQRLANAALFVVPGGVRRRIFSAGWAEQVEATSLEWPGAPGYLRVGPRVRPRVR